MTSFIELAERFAPVAVRASLPTHVWWGAFFWHTLRSEYNLGHLRLALDIVKTLRPHESLSGDEQKLLDNLDPRTFKAAGDSC